MYLWGNDENAGFLIQIYCAGSHADEEYERSLQDALRADRRVAAHGGAFVHVVIEEKGSDQPSAKWRRRFGQLGDGLRSQPYYFVLVTDSLLLRGVFTAVCWLRGDRPGHQLMAFASFEQACTWIRATTGADYPRLEPVLADIYARAER